MREFGWKMSENTSGVLLEFHGQARNGRENEKSGLLRSRGCIHDCTIPVLCTQVLPSRPREEPAELRMRGELGCVVPDPAFYSQLTHGCKICTSGFRERRFPITAPEAGK